MRTRHSGIQLDILSLYRGMLREARRRTNPAARANLHRYIQSEFRANRDVPRKEVSRIEWLLNYGRNKLEELQAQKANTGFSVVR